MQMANSHFNTTFSNYSPELWVFEYYGRSDWWWSDTDGLKLLLPLAKNG